MYPLNPYPLMSDITELEMQDKINIFRTLVLYLCYRIINM